MQDADENRILKMCNKKVGMGYSLPPRGVEPEAARLSTGLAHWRARADAALAGKQSNFRSGPSRPPLVTSSSNGVRITDVDGNDYIDFVLGMGPAIFGHSNEEIRSAVKDQADRQFSAASSIMHTTLEIELAEKIIEHVPCAERVRFGLSGTEADQLAMRLARGCTGKPYVVRCEGHYHGWVDSVFGGVLSEDPEDFTPRQTVASGAGIAPHAFSDTFMVPWNDAEPLEALLEARADEIAMVMLEPVLCNNGCCPPRPGYLEKVRTLCTKYKVLLCFDEVITGFRMDIGGAQKALGVTPDLAVFGKALAGGMPLSALAGRDDLMMHLKDNTVLGGGTFNSFPLAMASGLATVSLLERDDFAAYERMDAVQKRIAKGLREAAERYGYKLLVQGPRGIVFFAFSELEIAYSPLELHQETASAASSQNEQADLLAMKLQGCLEDAGVLVAGGSRLVISPAMTDADIDDAVSRFDVAMEALRRSE